jgi:nuclear pore complex protein Nup133
MSQRSRQRLATDAEKLYAAQQLWLRLNETILYVKHFIRDAVSYNPCRQGRPYDILSEAVYGYMNQVGEGHHDDLMRAFFRLRVADIGRLLPHVRDGTRRLAREAPAKQPDILSEANRIILVRCISWNAQLRARILLDHPELRIRIP